MTPSLAILRISSAYWRGLRLWVPLLLLWIPLVLISPLLLLALVIVCQFYRVPLWHALLFAWSLMTGLRGVDVDIRTPGNSVRIRIV